MSRKTGSASIYQEGVVPEVPPQAGNGMLGGMLTGGSAPAAKPIYGPSTAAFAIEKIENGYLVSIGGRRYHATCPEEICGLTSQWVLDTCEMVDRAQPGPGVSSRANALPRSLHEYMDNIVNNQKPSS